MNEFDEQTQNNPMAHPEEQPVNTREDSPKFGRLLAILGLAVLLIAILTFLAESYYTHAP